MAVSATQPLAQGDMMQLLLTQLTHQDPLNPLDSAQFTQQLVSLELLSRTTEMSRQVQTVGEIARASAPLALLGRKITAHDSASGQTVEGVVDAVDWSTGTVRLKVGDDLVNLTDLTGVSAGGSQ
jgi:flagellar basal-body rod modification protein FlgD